MMNYKHVGLSAVIVVGAIHVPVEANAAYNGVIERSVCGIAMVPINTLYTYTSLIGAQAFVTSVVDPWDKRDACYLRYEFEHYGDLGEAAVSIPVERMTTTTLIDTVIHVNDLTNTNQIACGQAFVYSPNGNLYTATSYQCIDADEGPIDFLSITLPINGAITVYMVVEQDVQIRQISHTWTVNAS